MMSGTPNHWTTRTARPAWPRGRVVAVLLAGVVVLVAGCKGRSGGMGGSGGGIARGSDPLIRSGDLIRPTNVPVHDRGTAGGRGRTDPLVAPTGRTGERTGAGYTDDPERWKGSPYVPNMGGVPASLAGRDRDGDELKIDSGGTGVPLRPAGGVVPQRELAAGVELDRLLAQLRTAGVGNQDYAFQTGEGGQVTFTARLPINANGAVERLTGQGATAAEAVQQVLDQIKADRK